MKRYIEIMRTNYLVAIWILLTLASCSTDMELSPVNPDKEQGTGTVTLTFAAQNGVNTRTTLTGPENLQHVKQVHLYIFQGNDDNAIYLKKKTDIQWEDCSAGVATKETSYTVMLKPGDYRFLAVGLDEASATTYTIDEALTEGSTTFAKAKATLATGKTKENIALSELFAGWNTTSVKENENGAVTINLYRRVAGVLGYFQNTPDNVKYIQVLLYEDQNTEIPLRKPSNDNVAQDTDFGTRQTGDTGNRILLDIDITKDSQTTGDGSGALGVYYSKGAYVLPKQAPTDAAVTHTLTVRTLTANHTTIVDTYHVVIKSSIDGSTNGGISVTEPRRFPLYANQLYSIGTKEAPVDLEENNEITITVNNQWDHIYDIGLSDK